MLTVHQLAKSYTLNNLFQDVTFSINHGDRAGLVGPNGCGKTTLLRIIAGEERASAGHITRADGLRVGFLRQSLELDDGKTLGAVIGRAAGNIAVLEAELAEFARLLADQPGDLSLQNHYDDLLRRVRSADSGRAAKILRGLGLDHLTDHQLIGQLSGGQKTRLGLALVLLDEPQLLLLDEPTNHLDIAMLEWLEEWLAAYPGGALIVSHDRTFLDRTVNRILAFDQRAETLREYAGTYSDYAFQVRVERDKQLAAYRDQQQEIRRVKQDISMAKNQAAYTERQASSISIGGGMMKLKGYKDYQRSIAKKVAKKAKAREKKLERYLDSEERVEKPGQTRRLRLDFNHSDHLGQAVIRLLDLSVGYRSDKPLISDLWLEIANGARIVLTGPNGSGKTTLLRTIAGQLVPLAGKVEIGPSVNLGTMSQEQDELDPALTPLQTVRYAFQNETAARTFLGYFLFTGDEPLLANGRLSFGQRARLELARLVVSGCNVLLLDEPINHLDIPSREQFEEALSSFDGTVLAVLHDRTFIERFASEVWWVEGTSIRQQLLD